MKTQVLQILILYFTLTINQSVFSQTITDTIYFSNSDTMIVNYRNKNGKLKFEEFYIKGKAEYYNRWYYKKNRYGFSRMNSLDPINSPVYQKEFNTDKTIRFEKTTLNNKLNGPLVLYKNGKIQLCSYYKKDMLDSITKIYFENGQLWTELIFDKDRFWVVLSNYNKDGKPMEKGTLFYGNGTRIVYDENANILYTEYFKGGILKRKERIKNSRE